MSQTVSEWAVGAKVCHTAKPEWGIGVVTDALGIVQDGISCQRLTIRFDKAGTKTVSTAFAKLAPATDTLARPAATTSDPLLLAEIKAESGKVFEAIPDPAGDPFAPLVKRAAATLDLYRFSPTGASLLEWAVMQSRHRDPLSLHNRHELEQLFNRFRQNLDQHARKTLKELKRQDPAAFANVVAQARPEAKAALRRIDIDR
mgnify:CR=1 FL=1